MKTLAAFLILASCAFAQTTPTPTKVPVASVSYPAVQFITVPVLTPAGIVFAQLAPNIVLDTTGAAPMLRVVYAGPKEAVDVFNQAAAYTSVSLSQAPAVGSIVKVYRNGLLMALATDYTLTGQLVTFTAAQGTAIGDVVQAAYSH